MLRSDVLLSDDQLAALGEHLRTCETHRPTPRFACEVITEILKAVKDGGSFTGEAKATLVEHCQVCPICAADRHVIELHECRTIG